MVQEISPLIAIVGQTASGKSALAMQLAERFGGEIIAADSRTVYRGMNIGTAKPSMADRARIPHHLLDIVEPDEPFTAADFQRLARRAIADISSRGKVPFLVGGSGLYVDSVLYNFTFRPPHTDAVERERLQAMSVEALQAELSDRGIPLPENRQNPRHLVRSIESAGVPASRSSLRPRTLVIGLSIGKEDLEKSVARRIDAMVQDGLVEELQQLLRVYPFAPSALLTPEYRAFLPYLQGQESLDEAKQTSIRNEMQYAKRQKTWFKRNPDIIWISNPEESVELITTFLNN